MLGGGGETEYRFGNGEEACKVKEEARKRPKINILNECKA